MEAEKVKEMREKLKEKGAKDPDALARYIARQKYAGKAHKRMVKKEEDQDWDLTSGEIADVEEFLEIEKKKKPKLGSGARFKKLTGELAAKGADDPKALAAAIGRKKYGKAKFASLGNKKKRG